MREIRVFVESPLVAGRRTELSDQAAQHVTKVLRLRSGASVTAFDGHGGEYRATLGLAGRGQAFLEVGEYVAIERESPLRITLLQGLARGERMDWVVQKATELGVHRIIPVATARSVVQLDAERGDKRSSHWRAIAAAACEQCGRNTLPSLEAPAPLDAALRAATPLSRRFVLEPQGSSSLGKLLADSIIGEPSSSGQSGEIALLVGPEGGLEDTEVALSIQHGFKPVSLGPRVLRTETAGLAALAALQCLQGDLA